MKISINAKCSDLCYTEIRDDNGTILFKNDGYVPCINSLGGGDYVDIDVDNETGMIIGWKPLTIEQVKELEND